MAVLHGFSIIHGQVDVLTALTLVMAAACLYCAYELWTRDTERAWVLTAVMNLAMIGVHLPMAAHQHGLITATAATPAAMTAATLVAMVEVALAAVVLGLRSRRYAPRIPDVT